MKNKIFGLLFLTLFYCRVFAVTTFTSPASGYIEVCNATDWSNIAWTTSGSGTPNVYVIQQNYTVVIGTSGNCTVALGNDTIRIYGKIGFKPGNNNLTLGSSGYIDIMSPFGQLGFGNGPNYQGNSSTQVTIGTHEQSGPFLVVGPDNASSDPNQNFQTSTFWTGAVSTDWNDKLNWNGPKPEPRPNTNVNAIIPDVIAGGYSTNFPVVSGGNFQTKRLALHPNAALTINSNASITVNDSLKMQGDLTIKSGGSLIQGVNSYLCACTLRTFTVERAVPAGQVYISSPISNVDVDSFGVSPSGNNGGQIIPNTNLPCNPDSIDFTSDYGNIMELRENASVLNNCAQSLWFVKSSGKLTNGRGYLVNTSTPTTLAFTGGPGVRINNGVVSYDGLTCQNNTPYINDSDGSTQPGGFHLVGNPYPSPIRLTDGDLGAGFANSVYIYNNGSWISHSLFANGDRVIPVGQGFQIRNPNTQTNPLLAPSFVLNNSFREAGNPTFYRQRSNVDHYLNVELNNGTHTDNTMLFFNDNATDAFDPMYEANRLSDVIHLPMIYTFAGTERLSHNALPTMTTGETKSVPMGVRTEVHGAHTLTFNDVSTLEVSVKLEDLKLNTLQQVTEGYVYNFTTQAGDSRDRFVLHFAAEVATGITTTDNGNITLYPNPTTGESKLVLVPNHGFTNAVVTDMSGRTVQTYELNQSNNIQTLNTAALNNGIYFIKLSGANTHNVLKLIKQ